MKVLNFKLKFMQIKIKINQMNNILLKLKLLKMNNLLLKLSKPKKFI